MRKLRKNARRKTSASYRWIVEPGPSWDNIAEMIGKVSGHIFEGKPTQLLGTAERGTGRILRVKATYGPGETVVLNIRKDGSHSVSFGLRMVTTVRQ
ncbi:hypothetical protein EAO27_13560 [Sphingopyxis sp. YF1]|uniref:hypothetical protein n=1 Tax=Sphingopyxis sp. YF1 TaxID=2482763 RepID=UPI001F6121AA|nr:hypothetical protein [Sphingopyxis sp. YF1]UNU43636.1 hypothetical protein EAO27_13560 [Sphingopyxis sp. YF1]